MTNSPVWAVDEPTISVTNAVKDPLPAFVGIVDKFQKAGAEGQAFQIQVIPKSPEFAEVEGNFFLIEKWPSKNPGGVFCNKVLASLKSLHDNGVNILLTAQKNSIDAQVFADARIIQSIHSILPSTGESILVVSPLLTMDILVHEKEHLEQSGANHPLQIFLSGNEFTPRIKRKLKRILSETMAYEKQYLYLEVNRPQNYGSRMAEMEASLGFYLYWLTREDWRALSPEASCSFATLLIKSYKNMPKVSSRARDELQFQSSCP